MQRATLQRATLHKADEEGRYHTCMIWSRLSSLCTAQDHQRWLCSNRPTESCLAGRSAPIRIKDRQYYKKLLDRYFGHNHALANENLGKAEKKLLRQTAQTQMKMNGYQGNMFCPLRDDRQFPHVRLSYSTSDRKVVLSHQTSRPDDSEAEELIDLEVGKCVPCCWVVVLCFWVANFWHGFFLSIFCCSPFWVCYLCVCWLVWSPHLNFSFMMQYWCTVWKKLFLDSSVLLITIWVALLRNPLNVIQSKGLGWCLDVCSDFFTT